MEATRAEQASKALAAFPQGDGSAAALLPLIYDELRELAHRELANERPGQTLQTTALVHEAYLRLIGDDQTANRWENRRHFFAAAGRAMRRILVDNARQRGRIKHGGGRQRVPLNDHPASFDADSEEILHLDEALARLESFDPRKSEIVHLRYFAGLTIADTAAALGVSTSLVEKEWRLARAWLHSELT